MAGGWARDGAVQDQIDASVESLLACEECGAEIPAGRREALPGVRLCVACQGGRDGQVAPYAGYNRRGNKDSQLR